MEIITEAISEHVWDIKYRYRSGEKVIDHRVEDTWDRVAKAVALVEKQSERHKWQLAFTQALENFHFLPGGRILAGAGTTHQVTLFNCFVMNIAKDSLKAIFDGLREGALTLQAGGGVGYDFSVLRPEGDLVKKIGVASSGPVSFMRIWDKTCSVMVSTGARRGAMMGVLRCDHPDIEAFIHAKSDPLELRHFNVSVMVSDEFMRAVEQNAEWPLIFPTHESGGKIIYRQWGNSYEAVPCRVYRYVKARALWEQIIKSAYDYAEPGVLFEGTINRLNNLWYREKINATNPCGEIPLPTYGACNLGAINLTKFVIDPFSDHADLNWQKLEEITAIATRFLDNVIDVSRYPLPAQKKEAHNTRRIGLGITGLADVFVMLGIYYGSEQSLQLSRKIMKLIAETTWQTSIELAKEKGKFSYFEKEYFEGEFVKNLSPAIFQDLTKYGVRNSHHNTIAPTGTISLLANNVSNGIEPIFHAEYERHVRTLENEIIVFKVRNYAYAKWNKNSMPPAWVDIDHLTADEHLSVQCALQPYIDNAISKTINIPKDFPFESLSSVYTKAYQLGLKGCTVFRPNLVTGSVLSKVSPAVDHCCQFD